MRQSWRIVSLAGGALALVSGALLLMGSFHSDSADAPDQALKRVELVARNWEGRLEAVRSVFRDQLLRYDIGYVVEHPEDFATWRIREKFAQIRNGWRLETGEPRALLLIGASGEILAAWGDTLGTARAVRLMGGALGADMALCPSADGRSADLVLYYRVVPTERSPRPARVIALTDARTVLQLPPSPIPAWELYTIEQTPLLAEASATGQPQITAGEWSLLASRQCGTLKTTSKTVLVFSKVHVPGMTPMVLASSVPTRVAGIVLMAILLLISGGAVTLTALRSGSVGNFERRNRATATLPSQPAAVADAVAEVPLVPDPQSPYPVVCVTPEGLVQLYNAAALKSCPRLKDTPVISDVLPSLEPRELSKLLESNRGASFESLFGSKPHSFVAVPVEEGILLYAHPLSASRTLEVALQQAQENFNTLCAVQPVPILLVDPRNHAIIEANPAASNFFAMPPDRLRGRIFDNLSARPVDLASSEAEFVADVQGQATQCRMRSEMVKIEGVPIILVTLQPPPVTQKGQKRAGIRELRRLQKEAELRQVTFGPAVLVSLNPVVRDVARRLLERTGHSAEAFSSLSDATGWLIGHEKQPEVVVIDVSEFPESAEWLSEIRRRHSGAACLAITDGVTFGLPSDGPNAYLTKPFDMESLSGALSHLGLSVDMREGEEALN